MTQNIRYSVDGDGIATLLIDVADRPMNVITPGFRKDLAECVEKLAADPAVRGAVIGSAKSSFMAGADIKDMAAAFQRGLTAAEAAKLSGELNRMLRRLETCGKPIAAAVNGVALGGGFEVALACHYRVMSDDPKAGVGFPEVKIGLLPGAGGTQRTPRLIGVTEALRLISEGRPLGPQDALKKGLVNELAPAAEFDRARPQVDPERRRGRPALGQEGLPRARRCRHGLAGGGTDLHGRHGAGREDDDAELSGAGSDPLLRLRRHAAADGRGAGGRVEVLRAAALGPGRPQPDAHDVHQQGPRRQAGPPPGRAAEVAGSQAGHPRRRHDGRGSRPRLGARGHGRRAARQHAGTGREGQGVLEAVAGQGRWSGKEDPGGCGRGAGTDQADGQLRRPGGLRPRDRGRVRESRHQGRRDPQGRGGDARRARSSRATPRRCRSPGWRRPRSARRSSSASTSSRRWRRCRWSR